MIYYNTVAMILQKYLDLSAGISYQLEREPVQLTSIEHREGYTRFKLPDLEHWLPSYLSMCSG